MLAEEDTARTAQPPHRAVRPDRSVLHREIGASLHGLPDRLEHGRSIVGMNALDERFEGPAKRSGLQAVMGFDGLGPSQHPGGVVHVPDPDVGVLQRKPHALFGGPQGLGAPVAFDAERNVIGHRSQRRDDGVGERMPGKERHDADDAAIHNQRVAGKRHHPFSSRPLLIAHFGIADDGVGQVRLAIPRDAPNLELSERDLSMRAVQMRVEARTRLQFEHAFAFVEGPDSGKGGPEMGDERLGALLQGMGERVAIGQRQANGRAQRRQLRALAELLLGALALRDVLLDSDEVADLALQIPHRRDGLFLCVETVVFAAIDHFAAPHVPGQNRVPQILVERRIMLVRLDQVPWILTHGLRRGIAGQF